VSPSTVISIPFAPVVSYILSPKLAFAPVTCILTPLIPDVASWFGFTDNVAFV